MFELALNCEIDTLKSLFLVNRESSSLISNKYFWAKKIEFENLTKLTVDLNYHSYLEIIDFYKLADKIIRKAIKADDSIKIFSTEYPVENVRHTLSNHISLEGTGDVFNSEGRRYICYHYYEAGYCMFCYKSAKCALCGENPIETRCDICRYDLICDDCYTICDNCGNYVCTVCEFCNCSESSETD